MALEKLEFYPEGCTVSETLDSLDQMMHGWNPHLVIDRLNHPITSYYSYWLIQVMAPPLRLKWKVFSSGALLLHSNEALTVVMKKVVLETQGYPTYHPIHGYAV